MEIRSSTVSANETIEQPMNSKAKTLACQMGSRTLNGAHEHITDTP